MERVKEIVTTRFRSANDFSYETMARNRCRVTHLRNGLPNIPRRNLAPLRADGHEETNPGWRRRTHRGHGNARHWAQVRPQHRWSGPTGYVGGDHADSAHARPVRRLTVLATLELSCRRVLSDRFAAWMQLDGWRQFHAILRLPYQH